MAQQTRKWNPGDAANAFVRVTLSDAGTMLGGMNEDEWQKTLDWFGGRCAYTNEDLVDGRMDRDHAIPMNRTHCGLHLYGNLLPTTREANRGNAGKHYRDFVEDPVRLERIESFVRESEYWERVSVLGDYRATASPSTGPLTPDDVLEARGLERVRDRFRNRSLAGLIEGE